MSEDWDGQAGAKSGGRRYGEDIQGGGKPRPYISGSLNTDTSNVGAGLAPALQTSPALDNLAQQTSPALVDLAFQPFLEGLQ